jgi:hypothetical protein
LEILEIAIDRRKNEVSNLEQLVLRSRSSGVMFMSVMDIDASSNNVVEQLTSVLTEELQ